MKDYKKKFSELALVWTKNRATWWFLGHYSGILLLLLFGISIVRSMQLMVLDILDDYEKGVNNKNAQPILWEFFTGSIAVTKVLDARSYAPFGEVCFRIPTVIHIVHLLVPSIFSTIAIFGDFEPKLTPFQIFFFVGLATVYFVIYIFYSFCYWKYVNFEQVVEEKDEEGCEIIAKVDEV